MVAPLALACSDDLPEVPETSSSTGGTNTVTTNTPPGTATDMPGTTAAATGSDSDGGTTVVLDGATTEVATTEVETTEEGTTEMGTTDGVDDDTIYEIQDGTIATGTDVDVRGVIVTGVADSAFFAQEPGGGEYSGVYVYLDAMPTVAVGDEVDILGVTAEFNDLTEIDASMGTVTPTGVTGVMLSPDVVTQADLADMVAEPWECVLVRIEGALTVVDLPGGSEFEVNGGGADDTRIDNFLYNVFDFPAVYPDFGVDASFTAIQGPLNFNFGTFKVAPRDASDLEGYMGGPPAPGESVENLMPGDLEITEIMYDPFCGGDDCEWIEIYNASGIDVNLFGLRIQDSTMSDMNQGQVGQNVLLPAGDYAVLARGDIGSWPYMMMPAAFYGGSPGFNNAGAGDLAIIRNSMEVLDQTASYPVFGAADDGISWKLDPTMIDATANDDAMNWCHSTMIYESPMAMDEYGTPGAVNEAACAML